LAERVTYVCQSSPPGGKGWAPMLSAAADVITVPRFRRLQGRRQLTMLTAYDVLIA